MASKSRSCFFSTVSKSRIPHTPRALSLRHMRTSVRCSSRQLHSIARPSPPFPFRPQFQHQCKPLQSPFSTSSRSYKDQQPADLSQEEYHELSEDYLNNLVERLEEQQEAERPEIEVEYSAGVLNIILPGVGTYVLNKQPPNKQIWLSSPVSGPKRYDWVLREGTGAGDWVYLRDGSSLTALLATEVGVKLFD